MTRLEYLSEIDKLMRLYHEALEEHCYDIADYHLTKADNLSKELKKKYGWGDNT